MASLLLASSTCVGSASAQLDITTDEAGWLTQFALVESFTFDDLPPGSLTTQYAGLTFDGFDPGAAGYAIGAPRIYQGTTGFNQDLVHGDKPTEPGCLFTSSSGMAGEAGDAWQVTFDRPIAGFCLKTGGLQHPSTFLNSNMPPTVVELFDSTGRSLRRFDLFDETESEYTTIGRDWGTVCVTTTAEIIHRVALSVSNGDYVAFDDLLVGWCPGSPQPMPPAAVGPSLRFTSKEDITWMPVSGATSYPLYRGTIPHLIGMASRGRDAYDHACESNDPASSYTDPALPGVGNAFYYLVTAANPCGPADGGLGWDSFGNPRPWEPCL